MSHKLDAAYWRERLLHRRYRFPASDEPEENFTAQIEHGGAGFFFPLGSADEKTAAAKALEIYVSATKRGWSATNKQYSRELIVSFEWCMNPVLWTYTTIHTSVGRRTSKKPASASVKHSPDAVFVVELDEGVRRALCWCVDQQAGFYSVACDSVKSFPRMLEQRKPRMVLLNRNLAGLVGFKSPDRIAPIHPGVPLLTYSLHVDGDGMFVSTPGGATGYLVRRIPPERLLDPILTAFTRMDPMRDDFLLPVKYYLQELLQLPSGRDNSALAKMTPREREVLELLSKGYVDKAIAQAMGISIWTVHGHLKSIFERLRVHTRTEAVIRYLEK
jgi:DNA-binding NarL/FixJ family response regulator